MTTIDYSELRSNLETLTWFVLNQSTIKQVEMLYSSSFGLGEQKESIDEFRQTIYPHTE